MSKELDVFIADQAWKLQKENDVLREQNAELKAELIRMTELAKCYRGEVIEQTELKNRVEDAIQMCLKNITKAFSNVEGGKSNDKRRNASLYQTSN